MGRVYITVHSNGVSMAQALKSKSRTNFLDHFYLKSSNKPLLYQLSIHFISQRYTVQMAPQSTKTISLSKMGVIWSLLALSRMAVGSALTPPYQRIRSCTDSNCDNCNTGNSNDRQGANLWNSAKTYPDCSIYNSVYFKGTQRPGSQGCKLA
jgi:hypothetical protein